MLQRLYVHNFRTLENFELNLKEASTLLIGKNGAGKSTIADALQLLQQIARGANRMRELADKSNYFLGPKDFARGRAKVPMRFEVEALLEKRTYRYSLALDLPAGFRDLRVAEEQLSVDGQPLYSRHEGQVTLHASTKSKFKEAHFMLDWHSVALPVIQELAGENRLNVFKNWLAHMVILAPIPAKMTGVSNGETLEPQRDGSNFAEWFTGLLSHYPAAYTRVEKYLRQVLPDLLDFLNTPVGTDAKSMQVRFEENQASFSVDFNDLSDGEKCFFLCAVVLAANKSYGPLFCFWDEPDNYLSLSEVGHFAAALRSAFKEGGQILVTSHNPELIRKFSNENTFLLDRKSHLEPTLIRLLSEVEVNGDLVDALIRGDVHL